MTLDAFAKKRIHVPSRCSFAKKFQVFVTRRLGKLGQPSLQLICLASSASKSIIYYLTLPISQISIGAGGRFSPG